MPSLIIGAEITPIDAPPIVLLAPDRPAYARLARLLTRGKLRAPKGKCELYLRDIAELGQGAGWIGIVIDRHEGTKAQRHEGEGSGFRVQSSVRREGTRAPRALRPAPCALASSWLRGSVASWLSSYLNTFTPSNLFLALEFSRETPDAEHIARMAALSEQIGIPLVACNDVHYHVPQRRFLQNILTCIREKCTVHNAGRRLQPNAERHLRPRDEVARRYTSFTGAQLAAIGRAAVARSVEIARRCTFTLDELRYDYPHEVVPEGMTAMEYLERETWIGAIEMYSHEAARSDGGQQGRTGAPPLSAAEGWGTKEHLPKGERDEREEDQDVSRPDCMAESDAACEASVSDIHSDARLREVRFDQPDAPCSRVDTLEHRRGPRTPEPAGIHPLPEDRPRVADGAPNTVDLGKRPELHSGFGTTGRIAGRNGPCAARPDPQFGESPEVDPSWLAVCTPDSSPPWLRGSVASSLPPPPWLRGSVASSLSSIPDHFRNLLRAELKLIKELRYEHYFLTVFDLCQFARSRGILCQGRGSAANSAVCYCLGITSVDPAKHDLLFERFMSKERDEPPDIDVDFEHERREEVFQYIYNKYGRERAAITGVVTSYRRRSAVRDVGKALGLSLDCVDALAKSLDWFDSEPLANELLGNVGVDPNDRTTRMLVRLVKQLVGFPRHLSQHVGGFVITENPLCEIVPLETSPMPGRTFIEWDKDDIDALGILKVDCLALGMLTAISKCFKLLNSHGATKPRSHEGKDSWSRVQGSVNAHESTKVTRALRPASCALDSSPSWLRGFVAPWLSYPSSLLEIPSEDPAVYDMICHADTIGVFQIESRAQMSMLPRLKPRNFYDLVIEVAIVRPGPIQGGMVHPYLRRRDKLEPVEYPSKAVERVLKKTLGVPLFQEQVMRMAVVAAGFTPGEADQLRRAMAAWRRNGSIGKFETKLIRGMLARGYSKQFAEQIYKQICGFGEYGFPESHAASFALLVYASAWLKRYHPAAFCAAMINAYPLGFYTPGQLIRDAIEHGVEVRGVDVNFSDWDCTLEEKGAGRGAQGSAEGWHACCLEQACSDAANNMPAQGSRHATQNQGAAPQSNNMPAQGSRHATQNQGAAPQSEPEAQARVSRASDEQSPASNKSPASYAPPPAPSAPWSLDPSPAPYAPPPAPSIHQFARCGVPRETLLRLAAAGAFRSLGLSRREALWRILLLEERHEKEKHEGAEVQRHEAVAAAPRGGRRPAEKPPYASRQVPSNKEHRKPKASLFADLEPNEPPVTLPKMSMAEVVSQDYESNGFSLNAHPMELVREDLESSHGATKPRSHEDKGANAASNPRIIRNVALRKTRNAQRVAVAGLVTCRQRPSTASGIVFMTLEDETAMANLVVKPEVYQRYRSIARGKTALIAQGKVQRVGEVIHVMVERLFDLTEVIGQLRLRSRDFH